ncbi:MAG TPA: hypothetical protein VF456_06705 [Vicinamibacterales bacterium]
MRMSVSSWFALACCVATATAMATAQTPQPRRPVARPAPPGPPIHEAPQVTCPAPLGSGVSSKQVFCDVLIGRDPSAGILITIPPHKGDVKLTFDLHNRHTFSEEQMKDPRAAYARYTASVGALTQDNTLISRAVVQSEFRTATDLIDRIAGGAGPGGLKAVAPTGVESITITVPEAESQVSILGEKLIVERSDGTSTFTSAGRPIAIISNVMIEYHPPPAKPAARPPAAKTPSKPPAKAPAPKATP